MFPDKKIIPEHLQIPHPMSYSAFLFIFGVHVMKQSAVFKDVYQNIILQNHL